MVRKVVLILFLFAPILWAGEWVLPWVASKDQEWASEIVLNNLGSESAEISLVGVRANGESVSNTVTVGPHAQLAQAAATLLPFASGPGYSVFISSSSDTISAAVRVASLQTASGFSPAMGEAIALANSSTTLTFPTMPADGFSAPAIVNLSQATVTATVKAYGSNGAVGDPVEISIEAHRPWAGTVTSLFPGLDQGVYLVVTADTALAGANFSFNSLLEPSMINAQATPSGGTELLTPILVGVDTSSTLCQAYADSSGGVFSKRDCPNVDATISLSTPDHYLEATIDWGSGCTNPAGVYHSGLINLLMSRQGGIQGGWMNGEMNFTNFVTRYNGSDATIDGSGRLEGSTASQNFQLFADLEVSGNSTLFQTSGQAQISAQLSFNPIANQFSVYGSIDAEVSATYNYSISANVATDDPILFDINTCAWPVSGRINFDVVQSGKHFKGWVDFNTGDCNTALANINGHEETINLSDIY